MSWPALSATEPGPILALAGACVVGLVLTRVHLALGPRLGHFAPPDVLHPGPVCLSGGVAIWVALVAVTLAVLPRPSPTTWLVLGGSLAMVGLGLWDDVRPLRPWPKLGLQLVIAAGAVALGLRFETPVTWGLHVVVSVIWLVAMANAFNLVDNMDGLAAGVAALAAVFLAFHALQDGAWGRAVLASAFAGAHAGFLRFNFKPARIFMGDCGSMGAGFFLGALAIVGTWRSASNLVLVVATPVLLCAVPIFNLLFVMVSRTLSGVPVFHGRADHINYRLVAHGLSERQAVVAIWGLSAACGMLALWYTRLDNLALVALLGVTTLTFVYLAVFLHDANVRRFYSDFSVTPQAGVDLTRLPFSRHRWRLFQMLADVVLVAAGYYLAYAIRFEGTIPAVQERNFLLTLLPVILLKVAVFRLFRLHGSHWRYVGVGDLLRIVQAVAVSQAVLFATGSFLWPGPLSRSVLVIDAILTTLLAGGSRVLLRLLGELVLQTRSAGAGVRTVIVGADDTGELVLRMARRNSELALNVVGFVDDDPARARATIHGVEVLGPTSALPTLCWSRGIRQAVVAMSAAPPGRIGEIVALCRDAGVGCKVLSLRLDDAPVPDGAGAMTAAANPRPPEALAAAGPITSR